jgi:hypothetical protein
MKVVIWHIVCNILQGHGHPLLVMCMFAKNLDDG